MWLAYFSEKAAFFLSRSSGNCKRLLVEEITQYSDVFQMSEKFPCITRNVSLSGAWLSDNFEESRRQYLREASFVGMNGL